MTQIFLDTNIFLRYLTQDKQDHYQECESIFRYIHEHNLRFYTSQIVFLETLFTLQSFYKVPRKLALKKLTDIVKDKNCTMIDTTNLFQAIKLHQKYNVKLADCLIHLQVPEKALLCTFDADFSKLPHSKAHTPAEILKKISKT